MPPHENIEFRFVTLRLSAFMRPEWFHARHSWACQCPLVVAGQRMMAIAKYINERRDSQNRSVSKSLCNGAYQPGSEQALLRADASANLRIEIFTWRRRPSAKPLSLRKVLQPTCKSHKTRNLQKLYRVHYNPRYRTYFTQTTEGIETLSGIGIISIFGLALLIHRDSPRIAKG